MPSAPISANRFRSSHLSDFDRCIRIDECLVLPNNASIMSDGRGDRVAETPANCRRIDVYKYGPASGFPFRSDADKQVEPSRAVCQSHCWTAER